LWHTLLGELDEKGKAFENVAHIDKFLICSVLTLRHQEILDAAVSFDKYALDGLRHKYNKY
jgi:hypothetical protein